MKNVLIVTYYFPPSGGSGVQRWLKFVKYLPAFGIRPVVLSVDPAQASYPQVDESLLGEIPAEALVERTATHELYGLYKRLTGEKNVPSGGVPKPQKHAFLHRIARFVRGNFFLPDPRRGWNRPAFKAACELIGRYGIDTVVTTSPPHSTQLIGLKLKQKFPNLRWIADFRDPWTDIFFYREFYPTHLADAVNHRYERQVLEACDRVLVTCPTAARTFAAKSAKIDPAKFAVVTNGYDEQDLDRALNGFNPKQNNELTISYMGVINSVTTAELDGLFEALRRYAAAHPVRLRFIGQSTDKLAELVPEDLREVVELLPYMPHDEALRCMAQSDVLLMVNHRGGAASAVIQAKLYEYLAVGKPILCLSEDSGGDTAAIIGRCRAGKVLRHGDSTAIAAFLAEARRMPVPLAGEVARYSRRNLCEQLVNFL